MKYIHNPQVDYVLRFKNKDCSYWSELALIDISKMFECYNGYKERYDYVYVIKRTTTEELIKM